MSVPGSYVMGDLFQFYVYQPRKIIVQKMDLPRELKVSTTNNCNAVTLLRSLTSGRVPYLRFHRRLLKSFSFREAAGWWMLLRSMSYPDNLVMRVWYSNPYVMAISWHIRVR